VLGVRILIAKPNTTQAPSASGAGLALAYASTLGLTITNPATIISFAALAATLSAGITGGFLRPSLLVLGVLLGSLAWWSVVAVLGSSLRTRMTARAVRLISTASGLAIVVLGLAAFASGMLSS